MKAAWGEKVGVGQRYAEKREEHKIKIAGEVKKSKYGEYLVLHFD